MQPFNVFQPQNGIQHSTITSTPVNNNHQYPIGGVSTTNPPSILVPNPILNNPQQAGLLCCNQVRCENQLLRRALRKEREKRQFIGCAYQELLRSYETLLDLKNIIDIPSSSNSLSSTEERQTAQRQQFPQITTSKLALHDQIVNPLAPIRMAPPPPRPMQPPRQFRPNISNEDLLDNILLEDLELAPEQRWANPLQFDDQRVSSSTLQIHAATRTMAQSTLPVNFLAQQPSNNGNEASIDFGRTFIIPSNSNERFKGIEQKNREKIRRNKSNCADIPRAPQQQQQKRTITAPIRPPPPVLTRQQEMPIKRGRAPFRDLNMDLANRNAKTASATTVQIRQRKQNAMSARELATVNFDGDGDNEEEDDQTLMAEITERQKKSKDRNSANWYFVSFDENNADGGGARKLKDEIAKRHLRNLLARSQARCKAIAAASRRRASVAANRRAVATDLLKEKRQLDDETLRVLHADSSSISAFPKFMRQMRNASRRAFHKSPVRQKQEEERERLLERATNRILAHSSAAISRVLAKSHLN